MSKRYRSHKEARDTRLEACRLAAQVMAGRPSDTPAPLLWSLAVFFEMYIASGCGATQKDFGPKSPAKLKVVRN